MPASDAVGVEGLVAIVSLEKERAVAFSPFAFPRGHEPNEFVPDDQQPARIVPQKLAEFFDRRVVALEARHDRRWWLLFAEFLLGASHLS